MESYLNNNVAVTGVAAPSLSESPPEPAFSSALNNTTIHQFTCSANHSPAAVVLMKLRIAVSISPAAHQFMEAKESWDMKQKNTGEEAIAATVHVEIKCPFCQTVQACQGVTSLYLAMSSESESDDTDGEGTSVLVTGGIGSQDADDDADEPQHETIGSQDAQHETIGSQDADDDADEPQHETRATSLEWILLLTSFALEILSAYFDQISSPDKPHYALIGMLLAIVALLACILDLLYKGKREGILSRKRGRLCCFHYPPPNNMLFGSFLDIFGLALAIVQCIFSVVQYYFHHRHASNPMKLSPMPIVFFFSLVVSKLIKSRKYPVDGNLQDVA